MPDLATGYGPAAGWDGPVFRQSKNFPAVLPAEPQPWKGIIPNKNNAGAYLKAVIDYCLEGNLKANSSDPAHFEEQFDVANNGVRKWYHAPWMHTGRHPREFVHGMTDERTSKPKELAETQTSFVKNFAVGFYNPVGAFTFHNVWSPTAAPNEADTMFREGTVTFKLLFTLATDAQVPWLKDAPVWRADIPRGSKPGTLSAATPARLLQVDVAIRDDRSKCGGWIFGTFHYDNGLAATESNPWRRLRPLCLAWGNDPGLKQTDYDAGQRPADSWINPESPVTKFRESGNAATKVLGWAGRANGPVDNPISSCLSCHSTAQLTAQHLPAESLIPPNNATENQRLGWFKDLAPGTPLTPGAKSMDFSLQLATGLQNYYAAHPSAVAPPHAILPNIVPLQKKPIISRSGEEE